MRPRRRAGAGGHPGGPMPDLSRLARLITAALASCALTWAFAGGALAQPIPSRPEAGAPAYTFVPGDADKAGFHRTPVAPAYTPTPGDADKASFGRPPAFRGFATARQPSSVNGGDDNTVALVFS